MTRKSSRGRKQEEKQDKEEADKTGSDEKEEKVAKKMFPRQILMRQGKLVAPLMGARVEIVHKCR